KTESEDLAQYPQKIKNLRAKLKTFRQTDAEAIRQGRASGIVLDNPQSSAGGSSYDAVLREYHDFRDHLNSMNNGKGFDGRNDWTGAQVQALDWSAIQRFHGVVPEDIEYALDRNTYEFLAAHGNSDVLAQTVRQEGGYVRDLGDNYVTAVTSPET